MILVDNNDNLSSNHERLSHADLLLGQSGKEALGGLAARGSRADALTAPTGQFPAAEASGQTGEHSASAASARGGYEPPELNDFGQRDTDLRLDASDGVQLGGGRQVGRHAVVPGWAGNPATEIPQVLPPINHQ